ncbi:hypothetical protein Clacol_007309 [Clathrus columnatus]|uniref:U three protein 7 n=1 Tax=Clathrus columnatus TaxID=1419009 RepID=A0AAV5AMA2_9AGAM|nr:hypothetical protein Clacol_007309 [Clathrus columnatus]
MHHLETLIQSIPTNILEAARAGTLPSLLASTTSGNGNSPSNARMNNSSNVSASPADFLPPPQFTLSNPSLHFSPNSATMSSSSSTPPSPRPLSHSYMYWDEQGCKRWQGETSGLPLLDALFDLSCASATGTQQGWGKQSDTSDEDVTGTSTPNSGHEPFGSQTEWFPGRVPKGIDAFDPETLWKVITAVVAPDLMDTHVDDPRLIAPSNCASPGTTFPSPASTWFELLTRLRLLPSASLPTLPTIQSLLLSAVFSIGLGKLSTGLSLLSSAITLSFDAGLHRSVEHYTSSAFTPIEREMRKRTFWGLYLWDKQAAAMFGRPCLIRARDCDVGEPASVDDEFLTNEGIGSQPRGIPSRMGSFIATVRYYIVLESVLELPLSPSPSNMAVQQLSLSLLPNHPPPSTLSPMSLHPPHQHQLFFPSSSPSSPLPAPPQLPSPHPSTSPYPSPSHLLSTLAALRTYLLPHWAHTPETLASEDVIRVTQAVRLHCLERFIGMLIWRGRLSAVISSVNKEDDASSLNSTSLSASDEALNLKMGEEEKEALRQCYAHAREIVAAYLCTATKGLMTYYGVHVIHQLTQAGRTLIAVVLCAKAYVQSQTTPIVRAVTPSGATTPTSPTSPVSSTFPSSESPGNNNNINDSDEIDQFQSMIAPSLEALRSCVSLLKRFSGRYVCGMRNGDLLEEFCRLAQISLTGTSVSSASTAPSSTQPTAPSTPHPPSSPRGSSTEPSLPTSPTSGVPSRPPWLKPIPITRKRRSHSTLSSPITPIPSRSRRSRTPPANMSSKTIYSHYSGGVDGGFRGNDLIMDMETDMSNLDMGLSGFHELNNSSNSENENSSLIGTGFGAGDEYESRRDVFLGVGIDIEMSSNGYGAHHSAGFQHSSRQPPMTPERSHHPHLFPISPHQSHLPHDLDIISLLNESSFETHATTSVSNTRNSHQISPSASHKSSSMHHPSQSHEVYVGLGDYGMGSLVNGDHTVGVSPGGMHLGRGIPANLGQIETTDPLERTWRLTQPEITASDGVGIDASRTGRKELRLNAGGVNLRWSRNGRWCVMGSKRGLIASIDWLGDSSKNMVKEINVGELIRDITYLSSPHHIAVAQSRNLFIYDQDLVELHKMKALIEPAFLEYLPYHWLLVCASNKSLPGTLSYLDVSTGTIVAQHRPKIGPPTALAQNAHNAVIYWGSGNGTVTLWTPSTSTPHVRLLAHLGPISALSVDTSQEGRYLATAGVDTQVKIWDSRNYARPVRQWSPRSGHAVAIDWSQRGTLAVAAGSSVNMYTGSALLVSPPDRSDRKQPPFSPGQTKPIIPPLYLTHPLPSGAKPASKIRWQPFTDVLAIGHGFGLSTILVPGSGEPNLDSSEGADPFETKKQRAEREVRSLLEKIPPDMITLNPSAIGSLAPLDKSTHTVNMTQRSGSDKSAPFRTLLRIDRLQTSGKLVEEPAEAIEDGNERNEEQLTSRNNEMKEKKRMRGKDKALKRYLKKKRKNVIDKSVLNLRAKIEKERLKLKQDLAKNKSVSMSEGGLSALDRFKKL